MDDNGITLDDAMQHLSIWLDADAAVATGQQFTVSSPTGGRTLTRADAATIQSNIKYWQLRVRRLKNGGIGIRRVIPL